MIKAILLDLDDTLLANPDHQFVPAFLDAVETYFHEQVGVSGVRDIIRMSIQKMYAPRDYTLHNTDIALQVMAQQLQRPEKQLGNEFAAFYRDKYPSLKSNTNRVAKATELVAYLKEQGYLVVIATNPLYPTEAIRQRLLWAGLSGDLSDYAFVTTADNMHFAKPDPAYYVEILARVGVEPAEAVMVGNSETNDIAPAQTAGIASYHVTAEQDHQSGSLADFLEAVQAGWFYKIDVPPLTPEMVVAELRGNLGALFGLLSEVKAHQWTQHPDPAEWSIIQVVCHLLEREASVQRARLQQILAENNPFLRVPSSPQDPTESNASDGIAIAQAFVKEREQTLQLLQTLTEAQWHRPARHSIFSDTSLLEMAHFTAQHDRMHITQICQTLGRCD